MMIIIMEPNSIVHSARCVLPLVGMWGPLCSHRVCWSGLYSNQAHSLTIQTLMLFALCSLMQWDKKLFILLFIYCLIWYSTYILTTLCPFHHPRTPSSSLLPYSDSVHRVVCFSYELFVVVVVILFSSYFTMSLLQAVRSFSWCVDGAIVLCLYVHVCGTKT